MFSYFFHAVAFQVFTVDAFDDFRLLWLNDEIAIFVFRIAEEMVVVDLHLALLIAIMQAKLYVLGKGF